MIVVCPFTDLRPEVRDALDASGYEWAPMDVSANDEAYYNLMLSMWKPGAEFIVVEHDIVVSAFHLGELENCPSDWCALPHKYLNGNLYHQLGCMKLSKALIERNPNAMATVGTFVSDLHPRRHWCAIDSRLQYVLGQNGEKLCRHANQVEHLSDGTPSHGCL